MCDMTGSSLNNTIVSLCLLFVSLSCVTWLCCMCGIILPHMWHTHRKDDNINHHQLNFVMFACAQISTSWFQNAIFICKLELKTLVYILSFLVTVQSMSYIACSHIACHTLYVTRSMHTLIVINGISHIVCQKIWTCDTTLCNWATVWHACVLVFRQHTFLAFIFKACCYCTDIDYRFW